jgi:aspartate ammonia-lyase
MSEILYGAETLRARENFKLAYKRTDLGLIYAMVQVKKAAALTYMSLDGYEHDVYGAIVSACDEVLSGAWEDQFVVDALQGGAGTSAHMNVNEVLAALANRIKTNPEMRPVHPLDDVNRGQSTNDVFPTALRIAAIERLRALSDGCAKLQEALQEKENAYDAVKKLGRTELMDAVPITLGQSFGAYAQAIARDRWRLYKVEERLRQVNLGGTAVGTYNNADRQYRFGVIENLRKMTGIGLAVAEYPMDITQNNDVFVEVSGLTKALAVNLMKIANDLRWMNSGPNGGLGEIRLEPMQKGSTIMPGKVNPVIPEMVMQAAMKVMANDQAVTMAAAHGEFELNAFLPLIADSLLENLSLLTHAVTLFKERCIESLRADERRCLYLLEHSYAFAADYTPVLGYDCVAEVVEKCGGEASAIREELERLIQGSKKVF